jgi:hypothetical protein
VPADPVVDREHLVRKRVDRVREEVETRPAARRVDAELLEHAAGDLDHGDAQHHLVLAADRHRVDHRALGGAEQAAGDADEGVGDVGRLLRLRARRHDAGHQDRIAGRPDLQNRVRQRAPEGLAQDVEVAADRDLERRDLAAVGVHDEDRGGAVLDADQEELAGRAHDGVRDLRVGDEDLLRVPRQVDDERTADRKVDAAGDRLLVRTDLEDRRRSDRPVRAEVAGERRRKEHRRKERRRDACGEQADPCLCRSAAGRSHQAALLEL